MSKVYAVKYKDGSHKLFNSWPECEANVKGVKGVRFKGFNSSWEATKWLDTENTTFTDDDNEGLKLYVDGSFTEKIKAAGWAYVAVENDIIVHEDYGVVVDNLESRNITGECVAAMKAIEWAATHSKKFQLIHDYAGLSAWLTGEWERNSVISKKYYASCNKYVNLIKFVNIRGHQGNKWNEHVDKAAGQALKEFITIKGK